MTRIQRRVLNVIGIVYELSRLETWLRFSKIEVHQGASDNELEGGAITVSSHATTTSVLVDAGAWVGRNEKGDMASSYPLCPAGTGNSERHYPLR